MQSKSCKNAREESISTLFSFFQKNRSMLKDVEMSWSNIEFKFLILKTTTLHLKIYNGIEENGSFEIL